MTSIKLEITWEDVQDIAKQRYGQNLTKKLSCFLLADIESAVRGWFNETKGDAISDSLCQFMPEVGFSRNPALKKALNKAFSKK